MNLLPLQIVLGLQVAAAVVIFIQLMAGDEGERALQPEKARRSAAAKKRLLHRCLEDDAR
jgi:hypothetical protein